MSDISKIDIRKKSEAVQSGGYHNETIAAAELSSCFTCALVYRGSLQDPI
jgi:hypothetical protein